MPICAILRRSMHDYLHLIRYSLVCTGQHSGKGEALVYLDQSKTFDSVDYKYLAVVLEVVALGPNFHHWIAAR